MAALFNFSKCQQDLLRLDKVPFEDIWLGTIQVSQRDLAGALPVINIFEKLLPCETYVSAKPVPCKPVEYTRRFPWSFLKQDKRKTLFSSTSS